tara:strand:+ start:513 stop:887 length:375 start_codon:yes stop_codon:yes gene_type:complete
MAVSSGILSQLIQERFGVTTRTDINPETSSIGTTVTELLKQDPQRLGFTIINTSSNVLYVLPDRGVSSSNGIRLGAAGGSVSVTYATDFDVTGYAWYGVGSASSTTLTVIAYVAQTQTRTDIAG